MTRLTAWLAASALMVLAGCADEDPMRAEIDDLKAQIGQLQTDVAKNSREASNAAGAAAAVADAQKASDEAAQENAKAITALSDRIDRMFKRPGAPAAKPCEPNCDATP